MGKTNIDGQMSEKDSIVLKANDILNEAIEEVQNLRNMINVLQLGFDGITCREREDEISSLYIINQQLNQLEDTKLAVLSDLIDKLKKE